MDKRNNLGGLSIVLGILLALSFFSMAIAAESGSNTPILLAGQSATVPLGEKGEAGVSDAPYKLTFKLAAVALHREDNKSKRLLPWWGGVDEIVNASDLDLGWAPGMDTSVMIQNKSLGLELRYLGLHQWSESKSGEEDYWWGYEWAKGKFLSRLHSAELNLHWWPCPTDRYHLLIGFRWLRLMDTLRYQLYEYDDYWGEYYCKGNFYSRNQFWGGQIGAEGMLYGKRDQGFSIDGVVKAGVFANKIKNRDAWYEYLWWGGYDSDSDRWDRTKTSFIGELGINANYAFTKNISATAGYEFLYLGKVAVPVNNWGSTQSIMFHGGRLGLNILF